MSENPADKYEEELIKRVIYALVMPAVRLALVFQLPVKQIVDLVQMAYYHETKRRGLKMREAADSLDVSMRKVAMLSKRLKQNFLDSEQEHALPRKIEFMLWAEPLSTARIKQVLTDSAEEEVEEALETLSEQGRITLDEDGRTPTWEVQKSEFRLVHDNMLSRIDGLNNLLASMANAVFGRFFRNESHALARTLSLRVREQDMPRLTELYENVIWETLRKLDADAKGADDAEEIDVSILWAPYQYVQRVTDAVPGCDADTETDSES